MKKTALFCTLVFIITVGCSSGQKKVTTDKNTRTTKVDTGTTPQTGWKDEDTYTVTMTAADISTAKEKARYKILKDIVNVRVLNGSQYTDIAKIKDEFEKPLNNGKVIKKQMVSGGVTIYFRITGRGLKKKFERK